MSLKSRNNQNSANFWKIEITNHSSNSSLNYFSRSSKLKKKRSKVTKFKSILDKNKKVYENLIKK